MWDSNSRPTTHGPAVDAICEVTGRRHRVSPCRSAYFASPWRLLALNLRRRRREAALLFPESWWHLKQEGSRLSHLTIIPNTKRHPNNTRMDQLPIFEVITGLPRPYHNTLWSLTFFVFFPPDFCIFLGCLGLERSHISSEKDQKQK